MKKVSILFLMLAGFCAHAAMADEGADPGKEPSKYPGRDKRCEYGIELKLVSVMSRGADRKYVFEAPVYQIIRGEYTNVMVFSGLRVAPYPGDSKVTVKVGESYCVNSSGPYGEIAVLVSQLP